MDRVLHHFSPTGTNSSPPAPEIIIAWCEGLITEASKASYRFLTLPFYKPLLLHLQNLVTWMATSYVVKPALADQIVFKDLGCGMYNCRGCTQLDAFVKDQKETTLSIVSKESIRNHVEKQIKNKKGLTRETIKEHIPYSLRITKTVVWLHTVVWNERKDSLVGLLKKLDAAKMLTLVGMDGEAAKWTEKMTEPPPRAYGWY